ncbi:hypothetical protein D910_05366, partial [Dendroctonus ponderosae]
MEVQHQSPLNSLLPDPGASPISGSSSESLVGDWTSPLIPLSPTRSFESKSALSSPGALLVPGRVTASVSIPQGAMTVNIEPLMLLGKSDVQQVGALQQVSGKIVIDLWHSAGVTCFGTLDLDKKSKSVWNPEVHWVRAVKLSDDCHTYNVQLKFQPSYRGRQQPKLVLQAVRNIEPGQELQLWFSEDILAMLQVVFLNPSNIQ